MNQCLLLTEEYCNAQAQLIVAWTEKSTLTLPDAHDEEKLCWQCDEALMSDWELTWESLMHSNRPPVKSPAHYRI